MNYTVEDIKNRKVVFPEPSNEKRRKFVIIPGLMAPNGRVGEDNPIFKLPSYFEEGYMYEYTDVDGNQVRIDVSIKAP